MFANHCFDAGLKKINKESDILPPDRTVVVKRNIAFILLFILSLIIPHAIGNHGDVVCIFLDILALQVGFSILYALSCRRKLHPWQKVILFSIIAYTAYFSMVLIMSKSSIFQALQLNWILPGLALLCSTILMIPSEKETRILLISFLLMGGVYNGILGLLKFLRTGLAYGPLFMNPNYFGGYLAIMVPLAIAWIFAARRIAGRVLAVASSLIITAALFFTYCRGSILALFIAVLCMSWWLRSGWLFPSTLGYYALCSSIAPKVYNRFLPLVTGTIDHSSLQRLQLWRVAIKIWQTRPVFGTGIGSYRLLGQNYGLPDTFIHNGYGSSCHNSYLEILSEQGVVGLAAFLVLLGVCFLPVLRRLFGSDRPDDPWLAGMAGGILAFFGQNMTNSLFLYQSLSWAAWLLLGLAACWVRTGTGDDARSYIDS